MDTAETPSADDLRAYREGRLSLSRFETVDRWLASLPPEEQERLLAGEVDEVGDEPPPLVAAGAVIATRAGAGSFTPEIGARTRFRGGPCIGSGGMGIVEALFDTTLGREVALKRCRPRRVDEGLALYATRLRVFRREAQITAQLEHPGIVPVHDVGTGPHGEPAFTMKRLDGEPMTALVARRREGEQADVAQVVELLLRIAEAVAYGHRRGVVHRDLKPDNVIIGALGAAYVIDWGLAGRVGAAPVNETDVPADVSRSEHGLGTPAWMAPEQFQAAPADPHMDVFALGGLLMAALTGYGPRDRVVVAEGRKLRAGDLDLSPLDARGLPRGLVAVARRCLNHTPANRYADGAAVAADLRQWLSEGLTSAERAGPVARIRAAFKRSPRLASTVVAATLALLILVAGFLWMERRESHRREEVRAQAVERLKRAEATVFKLAGSGPSDGVRARETLNELRDTRDEVGDIADDHPGLVEARLLRSHLEAAVVAFERQIEQATLKTRLVDLAYSYRIRGPWPSEAGELADVLRLMGLRLEAGHGDEDAEALRDHRHAAEMLHALVQLQRAQLLGSPLPWPLDGYIPDLIAAVAPDSGWRGLAEALRAAPRENELDLDLPDGPAADAALRARSTSDLLLATFHPDARLVALAHERLEKKGSIDFFWPRVVLARAAFDAFEYAEAERHALIALGSSPESLWPRLILAYIALVREDWQGIDRYLDPFIRERYNERHLEVNALKAASLAKQGNPDEARSLLQRMINVGQRYHLHVGMRGSLDRAAHALKEAGVAIPDQNPVLRLPVEPEPEPQPEPTPAPAEADQPSDPPPAAEAAEPVEATAATPTSEPEADASRNETAIDQPANEPPPAAQASEPAPEPPREAEPSEAATDAAPAPATQTESPAD